MYLPISFPKQQSIQYRTIGRCRCNMAALKTHQDYLYKFYASLVRQRPNSKMAIAWLLKHGYDEDLLPMAYLSINPMSKKIQKPKAKLTPVKKAVKAAEIDKELKAEEKQQAKNKANKPEKPVNKPEKPANKPEKPIEKKKPAEKKPSKKPVKCKAVKMETN